MRSYKKGAFIQVTERDLQKWGADASFCANLDSLDYVEVWTEYIPSSEESNLLRSLVNSKELTVHGPFIHMSLASPLESVARFSLDRCLETIEFASQIEAKVVTFHAGTFPVFEDREAAVSRVAERFSSFSRIQSPVVTLENMPIRKGTTREALGRLADFVELKSLLPELRLTLDIGHSIQNEDDYDSFLQRYSTAVENIHLHDAVERGKGHLPLGTGSLDLEKLLVVLELVKFSKFVGLETISREATARSWETWQRAEQRVYANRRAESVG